MPSGFLSPRNRFWKMEKTATFSIASLVGEVRSVLIRKREKLSLTNTSSCWIDLSTVYLTRKFQ